MSAELTWSDLTIAIAQAHNAHPEWRYGQLLFNVVHELRPDISERLRSTSVDPFYDSKLSESFLNEVWSLWAE